VAKILGKAGRYVESQSIKKTQTFVLVALIFVAVFGAAFGFDVALMIYAHKSPWLAAPILLALCAAILFGNRFFNKKLDALEREHISYRKGAVGEAITARILEGLSDDYVVFNDVTTEFGDIDHVVVGPTGVFFIDTKHWKGVVGVDRHGKLLLNGKPTTKDAVGALVATCAETKKKLKTLCGYEPYIRAVLCFTSARVDASFGRIKYCDCVRDERLLDYITDKKNARPLTKEQVESISRAFEMLAGMDKGFDASSAAKA
jgi:Nuclease-related domain